ncbi:MAG: biopolymer transporter ExbD, partial [Saprospiraceae bacterium]
MPKVKPHRKAPSIDMTAMCDVAFLLLTFFMLTAKAKPMEIVQVDTPSSISETKLPDVGTLTILVGGDGKIYLDMAGSHTRRELIEQMNAQFPMKLNDKEMVQFSNSGAFGVPRSRLKAWLDTEPSNRATFASDGIPVDTANNELASWVHNARLAQFKMKQEGKVKEEYVIVVKADQDTPYKAIEDVIHTLTDISVNKFNLITSMEG